MDPWGTPLSTGSTCQADVYSATAPVSHGTSTKAITGVVPGSSQLIPIANVFTDAGATLDATGRASIFLTCNFKYAHAQTVLVNPDGTLVYANTFIVPPNRAVGAAPEQFLQ
jgi:hypothetical protein